MKKFCLIMCLMLERLAFIGQTLTALLKRDSGMAFRLGGEEFGELNPPGVVTLPAGVF